jgi:hypothetical protein
MTMPAIDSRAALDHYELLNAVSHCLRHGRGDTDGFLHALHANGFMVVPIPPEFQPYEPVEPEQPNAAAPNATEPAPVPAPEPEFRLTNATASWEDWLKQARHIEKTIRPNYPQGEIESDLRAAFDKGQTPEEAIDDSVPF